jgi:hypothetical protein
VHARSFGGAHERRTAATFPNPYVVTENNLPSCPRVRGGIRFHPNRGGTTNEEEGSRGWQANPADGARDSALVRDDAHSHRSRDGWGMAAAPGADRKEGIVGGRGTRTNIRFPFKGHHASLIRVRSVVLLFWVREQVTCYALIFLSLPLVDATRHHDFRAT